MIFGGNGVRRLARATCLAGATSLVLGSLAFAADPMASNNGLYPSPTATKPGDQPYTGPYQPSSLAYPDTPEDNPWVAGQFGALSVESAEKYALALKEWMAPDISVLINDGSSFRAAERGWYDMVWSGEGTPGPDGKTDPTSGREAIMNTYTGQILPGADTWPGPDGPTGYVQNHAVIYYDSTAAVMLGELWDNLYEPNLDALGFPEGSVVVKAEAVTSSAKEWNVVEGAADWNVFRPSTENSVNKKLDPEVLTIHPFQMSVKVKDSIASPETGWVYVGYVYDKDADGATPWDRFSPLGVMWGNDPEYASDPNGLPDGAALKETWINPEAPAFTRDTLGWGNRLAGPMDVATRHNVVTPSGKRYQNADRLRASSCMSCHGSSEFPFTANLYPSPNRSFPQDGDQFMLYDPGSPDWARWFQNRPGDVPMSDNIGGIALDYDMVLMFALSAWSGAVGNMAFVREGIHGH